MIHEQGGENLKTAYPTHISKRLSFLYAVMLQLVQMTTRIEPKNPHNQESFDILNMLNLLSDFSAAPQINAKRDVSVLWRRPFAHIWSEIRNSDQQTESFEDYFRRLFTNPTIYDLNLRLQNINHGKRLRTSDGSINNLSNVTIPENTSELAKILLKEHIAKGLMTTTLLRSTIINRSIYKRYFDNHLNKIIKSIDNPSLVSRPVISITDANDGISVSIVPCVTDLLSPPAGLPSTDSMGNYRTHSDPELGEAVFEIRNIKDIGGWASHYIKVQGGRHSLTGFLTMSEFNSEEHAALQSQVEGLIILIKEIIKGEFA